MQLTMKDNKKKALGECDDAINQIQLTMKNNEKKALGATNQIQLTMKDNEKKALGVRKRQTAKSRAAAKRHKKESNKSKRLIQCNLHDLSVSAAKIDYLEMKVASQLRTQTELTESHQNAMAEVIFLIKVKWTISYQLMHSISMWRRTTCINV